MYGCIYKTSTKIKNTCIWSIISSFLLLGFLAMDLTTLESVWISLHSPLTQTTAAYELCPWKTSQIISGNAKKLILVWWVVCWFGCFKWTAEEATTTAVDLPKKATVSKQKFGKIKFCYYVYSGKEQLDNESWDLFLFCEWSPAINTIRFVWK